VRYVRPDNDRAGPRTHRPDGPSPTRGGKRA
jgi:hypothetical protein